MLVATQHAPQRSERELNTANALCSCAAKRPNVTGCGQACLSCGKADSTSAVEEQIPLSRGGVNRERQTSDMVATAGSVHRLRGGRGDLTEAGRFVRAAHVGGHLTKVQSGRGIDDYRITDRGDAHLCLSPRSSARLSLRIPRRPSK